MNLRVQCFLMKSKLRNWSWDHGLLPYLLHQPLGSPWLQPHGSPQSLNCCQRYLSEIQIRLISRQLKTFGCLFSKIMSKFLHLEYEVFIITPGPSLSSILSTWYNPSFSSSLSLNVTSRNPLLISPCSRYPGMLTYHRTPVISDISMSLHYTMS